MLDDKDEFTKKAWEGIVAMSYPQWTEETAKAEAERATLETGVPWVFLPTHSSMGFTSGGKWAVYKEEWLAKVKQSWR